MMRVSNMGVVEIAEHEGIVPAPYRDSVGVVTWGIGHTHNAGGLDPREMKGEMPSGRSLGLAIDRAIRVFKDDLDEYERRVNDAIKVPLKQHEFDALVSFDFNTGGIYRANLTKAINSGDKSGDGFMGWLRPPEIRGRREAEMNLFRTGDYEANGDTVPVWGTNGKLKLTGIIDRVSGTDLIKRMDRVSEPASGYGMVSSVVKLIMGMFRK